MVQTRTRQMIWERQDTYNTCIHKYIQMCVCVKSLFYIKIAIAMIISSDGILY